MSEITEAMVERAMLAALASADGEAMMQRLVEALLPALEEIMLDFDARLQRLEAPMEKVDLQLAVFK